MNCPKCGSALAEGAKFCPQCGAEIETEPQKLVCPSCGEVCQPGTRFCSKCGTSVGGTSGNLGGSSASMPFGTAIKTCFQKYATFGGRARRSEYWWLILGACVVKMIPLVGDFLLLALVIPILSAAWRRMHDVGKSGWFGLIPVYNIILAVRDSAPGDNKYGPNPKRRQAVIRICA